MFFFLLFLTHSEHKEHVLCALKVRLLYDKSIFLTLYNPENLYIRSFIFFRLTIFCNVP